jgi:hypothetical protein
MLSLTAFLLKGLRLPEPNRISNGGALKNGVALFLLIRRKELLLLWKDLCKNQ